MNKPAGKSSIPPAAPVDKAGTRQLLLVWYLRVGIVMVVLALVFGSKFTTPVHAELSGEWGLPLGRWGIACIVAAILAALVAVLFGYLQLKSGETVGLAAMTLLFSGVSLVCAHLIAEGVNVHFASAPAIRVTTKILRIEPSSPGSKSGPTLYLAYWGADHPSKVVTVSMNGRVIHMDLDKKYATFHVREGFLGIPYASEYK